MRKKSRKREAKITWYERNIGSITVSILSVCISYIFVNASPQLPDANRELPSARSQMISCDDTRSCTPDDCKRGSLLESCKRTCGLCDKACQKPNSTAAIYPGYISNFADRVSIDYAHLQPKILSRDPLVVQFDSFLSEKEAVAIEQLCDGGQRMRSLAETRYLMRAHRLSVGVNLRSACQINP